MGELLQCPGRFFGINMPARIELLPWSASDVAPALRLTCTAPVHRAPCRARHRPNVVHNSALLIKLFLDGV
jgi:hypothetical protein